jgi:phosphatidylinositol-3-phosphatase
MRHLSKVLVAAALVLAFVDLRPLPADAATVPAYDHVFLAVMENHSYSEIVGSSSAPYFNSILSSGALATSYYGVTHPSLPNYLALVGGSSFGITSDCTTCWLSSVNVADRVESAGKSWKAYEESMPSACYVGDSYPYAQKHNPLLYFNDIRTNTTRCRAHMMPYTQMATDLQSASTTPSFAFLTPNMCNDTHDCTVATGDAWLKAQVPVILGSPAFKTQRSLLLVTWDEDDSSNSNHIPLLMLGSGVRAGYRGALSYNHFSLLRTIEGTLGLATITTSDANAALMTDFFGSSTTSPPPATRCTSARVVPSTGSARAGTAVTFTTTAAGCPTPVYEVWLRDTTMRWHLMRSWGAASWTWTNVGWGKGAYRISIWANQQGMDLSTHEAYAVASYSLT